MSKNTPTIDLNSFKNLDYPKKMFKHYSLSTNSVNVLTGNKNPY